MNGLAVVTGASSGIGLELARCCAEDGYALLICSDTEEIEEAARDLRARGAQVESVQADLATTAGVAELVTAIGERPVEALLANAGIGLGDGFLDQDLARTLRVVDLNVKGTLGLVHPIGRRMRAAGRGRRARQERTLREQGRNAAQHLARTRQDHRRHEPRLRRRA